MKGIREIKGRIRSVKNTSQITRAMQLVAASKMKKAQNRALEGRPYTMLMAEMLACLPANADALRNHPLVARRENIETRGILVVSTDKGLCGGLNGNLFRYIAEHVTDKAAYVSIGRKAKQFLSRTKRDLIADFSISDEVEFHEIRAVVEFMLEAYLEGKIDTIEVLYPRFVNTLQQEPTIFEVVPIIDLHGQLEELRKNFASDLVAAEKDEREMVFEPSPTEILEELPALFVKQQIFQRILEMKASEQSARMVAMKSATDNANNLVDSLTLEFNKARQAGITQEILELAAASASD